MDNIPAITLWTQRQLDVFTNWKSQPLSIHRALYEMKVERDANWYINPIDFMNQGDVY